MNATQRSVYFIRFVSACVCMCVCQHVNRVDTILIFLYNTIFSSYWTRSTLSIRFLAFFDILNPVCFLHTHLYIGFLFIVVFIFIRTWTFDFFPSCLSLSHPNQFVLPHRTPHPFGQKMFAWFDSIILLYSFHQHASAFYFSAVIRFCCSFVIYSILFGCFFSLVLWIWCGFFSFFANHHQLWTILIFTCFPLSLSPSLLTFASIPVSCYALSAAFEWMM